MLIERIARQQNKAPVCVPIQPTRQSQCIPIIVTTHVETVCLLSKLHEAKHHVNVKLDMDEMDITSAESKAAYEEIKKFVL